MDFPKEYYWKRKLNTPQILNFPKPMGFNFSQSLTPTLSKGCIKIEQYEYQQENLLGVGYTSKVYLGHLSADPRQLIAIKVVDKRKIGKEKQNLALLKQQMEVHRQLDHPNIIKCHRIIEKGCFYYFVLEYCSQGTLESFIKKHDRLAESTVVTIMEQIISGYRYLLEKKVLHRDLKPANILKSGYTWKICDFGFSVIGKRNLVGDINVGTPSYMAPEALQRTYYSPKTDFFALGVICYEMLFGNPPWQNKNEKVLLEIMQTQKIDQEKLSSIANKNISEFITRCCEPIERRRIGVKQFEQFSFWSNYDPSLKTALVAEMLMLDIPSRPSSKALCTTRENSLPTTASPSQTTSYSTAKGLRKESIEQIFSGNNAVVERELFICQLLYCLVKNIGFLPLTDEAEKDMAATIFTKHAAYIVRRIKHSKLNYLSLKKWEEYIVSDTYQILAQEASQVLHRIEQAVKGDNRKKNIVTIRVINRKFDELTYDKHLTGKCVGNLKQYATFLMESIVSGGEKQLQQVTSGSVQALQYLNKYFGYLGSLSYSCEQSRAIAVSQEYRQRKDLLQNFAVSLLGSEELLKLKEQVENRRV